MFSTSFLRRRLFAFLTLAVLVVASAACSDDPEAPEEDLADRIHTVRLQIGSQTINLVNENPPASPIVLARGNHTVTATALDAQGATITLPTSEFELRFNVGNPAILTYTKSGSFSGTFNALSAGQTTIEMFYFHIVEGHPDYEVKNISVTVQ